MLFRYKIKLLLAMSSKRKCRLSPNSFYYVCEYYIGSKQQKRKISPGMKLVTAYSAYFGVTIGDQDKTGSPHVCCGSCRSTLEEWLRGKIKCMPFAISRIWREPTNHLNDCYFCMVDVSHYRKSKDKKALFTRAYHLQLLQCHIVKIYPFLRHPC